MGFIIADGFDDRYYLNNDDRDGFDDVWDGFGLYDDVYLGGCHYYHPEFGGSREIGRYGGYAAMLTDDRMSYEYQYIEKVIPSGKNWSGGFAFNSADDDADIKFYNSTKGGPHIECDLGGNLVVRRTKQFASTTEVVVRSDATARITMWGWHYVTFQFHAGDVGSDWIKIWIDEELVIDESGITLNFFGAVDGAEMPNTMNGFDDIWLRDDTNVITEPRILALFPDAAGDDAECAPVGEASNYLTVDEYEQDFDTTYNLVDAGEKDSFNMDDITDQVAAGTVHALVARFLVKGDAGNTEDLRPYVISGGTKYNGSAQTPVEGRYSYIQEIWETNPDTSNPWTVGEIDSVQIGYEAV